MYSNGLDFENMIPAIVVEYDRATNLATVQPAIMNVDMADKGRSRQPLALIPTLALGAGGFVISFPIKKGDLGWIHAADRDLSTFKKTLAESTPPNGTIHKFGQGMFIPDVFRQYTINGEDADAMVIQAVGGQTRISIKQDSVKITATSLVTVDANAKFTKDVSIDGSLTVAVEATVAGIPVTTHGHISSVPGQRTAGGMIT